MAFGLLTAGLSWGQPPITTNCDAQDPCNLVTNGGFEGLNPALNADLLPTNIQITNALTASLNILWFEPNTVPTEYDCNDYAGGGINPTCGRTINRLFAPITNLNNADIAIANGSYTALNSSDMHLNKRNLYKRLRQDPSLSQNMPVMQQFETTEATTPVGQLDLVKTQTETAMQLSSADSVALANCQMQIQLLTDSVRLIDSIGNDTAYLHALQNQLATLVQLCDSTAHTIQNAKHALLDNTAAATNAAINAAIDVETAEKLVNSIYFNTLAKNINFFDANQLASLQIVSAACPDDLGNVVYQARAMYALVADVDMLSKAGCANSNNMEAMPSNIENDNISSDVILYPNPAKDKLILQQSKAFLAGTEVQIYNSLGQLMQSQVITNESQIIELNVSTLANGSYFVRINGGETVTSKLFIISK